jgi:mannosyltransferase
MPGLVKSTNAQLTTFIAGRPKVMLTYLFVVLLTITAAVLRLHQLGYWSFGVDEVITVNTTIGTYQGGLWPARLELVGPSYWLIGAAFHWLGVSEWSARLGPALIGISSIPLLFLVVHRFFNARIALVFITFLTVSHWHINVSQNARYTSSLLLFYALALFFFYRGMERERLLLLLSAGFFLALATIERLFAVMLVPILGVYLIALFMIPNLKRPFRVRWQHIGLLILPGLIAGLVIGRESLLQPSRYLTEFARQAEGPGPLGIFFSFGGYMNLPLIGFGVLSAVYLTLLAHQSARRPAGLYFGLAAMMPLVGIMTLSMIQRADARYVIVAMPGFFMLAALAIDEMYVSVKRPAQLLVLGFGAVLLIEPVLGAHYPHKPCLARLSCSLRLRRSRAATRRSDRQRSIADRRVLPGRTVAKHPEPRD